MKQLITTLLAISLLIMTQVQVQAQTNYRVNAYYAMDYDGSQFIRTGDSTRAYFRGSHTFADLFGIDIPQYLLFMLSAEQYLPTYPQEYSKVSLSVDSYISYELNGTETAFQDAYSKVTSTVNTNGNITELLSQDLISGIWQNSIKEIYTYNSSGQITEYILQEWQSSAWKNSTRQVSVYNAANKLQEFTSQSWSSGSWSSDENYIYEYDAAGNCTQSITREPNGSSWDNVDRTIITYDANHHGLTYLFDEWVSGAWEQSGRATMTYNSNGDILTLLTEDYNSSVWENSYRETFSYSGNKKTECLQESFDGGVWNKSAKTKYNYATSGLLENIIVQWWDDPNTAWLNGSKAVIGYNSQNLISFIYNEQWNLGDYWEKTTSSSQYRFFYETYEGENTGLANFDKNVKVNIYPNPASTILNIAIDSKIPQSSTMTVYDITGRICMLHNLEKAEHVKIQIDISKLPTGSYYLKIANAQGQIAKSFQIVK